MSRWRAFAIHLGISLLIIGGLAFGLFYLWYPPDLLGFAKADKLFGLIAGIDIIVGPLLTLIVFKAGKKTLKLDLTVISLLQVAFLAYGLWTVWISRPVFFVAAIDRYEVVFAHEVHPDELEAAAGTPYAALPWFGPMKVGLRRPATREEFELAKQGSDQGREMAYRPRFYIPYSEGVALIRSRARAPGGLQDFSSFVETSTLTRVAEAYKGDQGARFVPITSARGDALMRVDPLTGEPLHYVL